MSSSKISEENKSFFNQFRDESGKPIGVGRDINFKKHDHKNVKFDNGVLRCQCGVAWGGERLGELEKLINGV